MEQNDTKNLIQTVILAGGKGTRLAPYTATFPKPLMPLDDMPILEIVIRQLKKYGLSRITLTVGHLAELIQAFFNHGEKFGVNIDYKREDIPLGTAGSIKLVENLSDDILVMDGDILTDLNYTELFHFHKEHNSFITIAALKKEIKINYGVVEFDKNYNLKSFHEKPSIYYDINMGIYVMNKNVTDYIEVNKKIDIPELISRAEADNKSVLIFPYDGYWKDIGNPVDYAQAQKDFEDNRKLFF